MKNRKEAMQWWNELDDIDREEFTNLYYPDRHFSTLTGREIERIHLQEIK